MTSKKQYNIDTYKLKERMTECINLHDIKLYKILAQKEFAYEHKIHL